MTATSRQLALPLVETVKLCRVYGSGRTEVTAVTDVDLLVQPGDVYLVMGPSGSGKTTLLSLIGGLLRPTSGTISVAGHELSQMSETDRARLRRDKIGFVFQDFNLLGALTARENVEIALNLAGKTGTEAKKRAIVLLTQFGMQDRLDFIPAKLSGGEKQRVAIARALANDPQLILADEPTANLDSVHGMAVVHLLAAIATSGKRAVIIVSHDDRLQEVATRIARMEDGRLLEECVAGSRAAGDAGRITGDHPQASHENDLVV